LKTITTDDGSFTLHSTKYGEAFHSLSGARTESFEKFARPGLIQSGIINKADVSLLDIGFGLGYNSGAAIELCSQQTKLNITAVEMDISIIPASFKLPQSEYYQNCENIFNKLKNKWCETNLYTIQSEDVELSLLIGDARKVLTSFSIDPVFDLIFLDGFSTKQNTELWTLDFINLLLKLLNPNGLILTYSSAYPVISAFFEAGAFVYQTKPQGRTSGGLAIGHKEWDCFDTLDTAREKERLATTGCLYYRDPTFTDDNNMILEQYRMERDRYLAAGGSTIKAYRKKNRNNM